MRLSEFDSVVKHRKGEDNPVADFLSRWATTCLHAYDEHEARQATAQLHSLEAALTEAEAAAPDTPMVKELQYLKRFYALTRSMARGVGEGDAL